jgi:hypothetical protein
VTDPTNDASPDPDSLTGHLRQGRGIGTQRALVAAEPNARHDPFRCSTSCAPSSPPARTTDGLALPVRRLSPWPHDRWKGRQRPRAVSASSRRRTNRRRDLPACGRRALRDPARAHDAWQRAAAIRDTWLSYGLSTRPADRPAAETTIAELYASVGANTPEFVWVDSPMAALPLVAPHPGGNPLTRLRSDATPAFGADWPLPARLATAVSAMRASLDTRVGRPPWWQPWRPPGWRPAIVDQLPVEALHAGADIRDLLDVGVGDSLHRSVWDTVGPPLRTATWAAAGGSLDLTWYGQHEVDWIARYDVHHRLGTATFRGEDLRQLDWWATLARSCGWWWPQTQHCVISERTTTVHTESVPGTLHNERRAHNPRGHAVGFTDGWGTHSWHGTPVPAWVIANPTVDRIAEEPNVEVRRCAIERLGWDTYIHRAGLALVASAADPGNPGCDLHLYDLPTRVWGAPTRVLLAVNGSVERDGQRRRYGLSVPGDITDPVAAAGWSYGLSAAQYTQLQRRT